ncbi:MAG: hypothetical protein V1793_08655 [Pseudomonadota bacterium]
MGMTVIFLIVVMGTMLFPVSMAVLMGSALMAVGMVMIMGVLVVVVMLQVGVRT